MFVIQDGHHLRPHIADSLAAGRAGGAILSPSDLAPGLLAQTADEVSSAGGLLAIDPQIVAMAVIDANPKKLLQHGHIAAVGLPPRDFRPSLIRKIAENALELQVRAGATVLLTPTVSIESVDRRWAQVAQQLTESALEVHAERNLEAEIFVSVAARDLLLRDEESVHDLLDEITRLDAPGVYLLSEIDLSRDLSTARAAARGTLTIISELTRNDRYRLLSGYTGFAGVAHRAAGAEIVASGWFHKQQWWSPAHWEPGAGGQAPAQRVALQALFGEARWDTEIRQILEVRGRHPDLVRDAFSGVGEIADELREAATFQQQPPDRAALVRQFFEVLCSNDQSLTTATDPIQHAIERFDRAEELHTRLKQAGVSLNDLRSGLRLVSVWRDALSGFAT